MKEACKEVNNHVIGTISNRFKLHRFRSTILFELQPLTRITILTILELQIFADSQNLNHQFLEYCEYFEYKITKIGNFKLILYLYGMFMQYLLIR